MKTLVKVLFLAAATSAFTATAAERMPSREAITPLAAPVMFRAPQISPSATVELPAPLQKAAADHPDLGGALKAGDVRETPYAKAITTWHPVPGGYVARFKASSAGATGLRVRLDLGVIPGDLEVRAAGEDGRVLRMAIDPALGPQSWTPWTDGETQIVEVFSRVRPAPSAVKAGAVLHIDLEDKPKAAAVCTVNTNCATGDAVLDAAIAERKKSIARLLFIKGSVGGLCSGTLINTQRFPEAFVLTANHCVSSVAVAATTSARFFYESTECEVNVASPAFETVSGGAELVFSNFHVDSTLLRLNSPPPAGAVYGGWNAATLLVGTPVTSLSHPTGDTSRLATGVYQGEGRPQVSSTGQFPQNMSVVRFTRGIIEGGSSGSGIFTLSSTNELELRGVLCCAPSAHNCSTPTTPVSYGRFDILAPQIAGYITTAAPPPDDAPNRARDWTNIALDPAGTDMPLNLRPGPMEFNGRTIAPAGDLDVYRFNVTAPGVVAVSTEGGVDMIGSILDESGAPITANDDRGTQSFDFGITKFLNPGTYFLQLGHYDGLGTGTYSARLQGFNVSDNYTDLWWNANESGWGMNINHQGNTLFATLFTYDTDGSQMWLVMTGTRQADGTYSGDLLRTTGPRFDANPWTPIGVTTVGTMRIAFGLPFEATLTYTVNGVPVTKAITRQRFSTAPTCEWSAFDRSATSNYQDLWWNPNESGWGINLTHQGDIIFGTLFTYDVSGRGMWLILSKGDHVSEGVYSGALYRTSGPAFNAVPWSPIVATQVGTMTLTFPAGNNFNSSIGTLTYTVDGVSVTKQIQRQVFSQPKTECR